MNIIYKINQLIGKLFIVQLEIAEFLCTFLLNLEPNNNSITIL